MAILLRNAMPVKTNSHPHLDMPVRLNNTNSTGSFSDMPLQGGGEGEDKRGSTSIAVNKPEMKSSYPVKTQSRVQVFCNTVPLSRPGGIDDLM